MLPISAILDDFLVCGDCKTERQSSSERDLAAIRAFREDGGLALRYLTSSPNPFADTGLITAYADAYGFEYWLDEDRGVLLHMAAQAHLDPPPREIGLAERIPVAALRDRAVMIVERNMRGFGEVLSSLHPLEGNRRKNVYYFRWEDYADPLQESDPAPFAQTALYADGTLAAYTNTLLYGRHRELCLASR